MEEDMILQQPTDRRLGNTNSLPPGPPGAEFDTIEFDSKNAPGKLMEKDNPTMGRSNRRRSPSDSPGRKRRSVSRSRRSPSSPPQSRDRRRRSPTPPPRRNRYRDYSPDNRRRYDGGRMNRRSPDRRRSPFTMRDRRIGGGGRYRGRGRSSSRSMSRSPTPVRRTSSRWSPKKKPNSPPSSSQLTNMTASINPNQASSVVASAAATSYSVMGHPGQQIYGDNYTAAPYNQYGVPPPQASFVPSSDGYGMPTAGPGFNTAYPPPTAWDAYAPQPQWLPPPNRIQPMVQAPTAQQQQPPPTVTSIAPSSSLANQQQIANSTIHGITETATPISVPAPNQNPVNLEPGADAVAQEVENQREELKKQRNNYMKKTTMLRKELKMLKEQRKDLHGGSGPPSPTTKGFIDENEKLQNQIQKKLNTIENVIDMLTGIIGEENLTKEDDLILDEEQQTNKVGKKFTETTEVVKTAADYPNTSESRTQSERDRDRNRDHPRAVKATQKKKNQRSPSSSSEHSSSDSSSSSTTESTSSTERGHSNKTRHSRNEMSRAAAVTASASAASSSAAGATIALTAATPSTATATAKPASRSVADDEDDDDDSSAERLKNKVIESMKSKQKDMAKQKSEQKTIEKKERFNYVFYDPEMHWCQTCDIFPKTARDYLNHLHSREHMDRESIDTPWHLDMVADQFPTYENAPIKRTPIRGLTFFVPATAWFCKLCNIWMGDLHCASTHLKSQLHANRYSAFLEENPHYEVNWLADRQLVLNEQKSTPLPPQITSISTTAAVRKKSKKEDEKVNKKRKKKSEKKQKKKKKKASSKKRKKMAAAVASSSATSTDSSSTSTDDDEPKKKRPNVEIKDNDNPNPPGASIRLTMRKQETTIQSMTNDKEIMVPVPPPPIIKAKQPTPPPMLDNRNTTIVTSVGKPKENIDKPSISGQHEEADSIIQQWNSVQPVISESEKKLLEQLKGKLKYKPKEGYPAMETLTASLSASNTIVAESVNTKDNTIIRPDLEKEVTGKDKEKYFRDRERDIDRGEQRGRDIREGRREDRERGREENDRRQMRRSRSRSRTRSRSRGRDYRRYHRSRSRSRGHFSPRNWGGRRGRMIRSRSRSARRRSRSYDRRRRVSRSRTRTRSRSMSPIRVEKPVVRQPEFRPRVPEKEKEKEKKPNECKDKKEKPKSKSSTSATTSGNSTINIGKKLPFIGKMPVFKKQVSGQQGENGDKRNEEQHSQQTYVEHNTYTTSVPQQSPQQQQLQHPQRPPPPTAAQIQMAMMEDAYGNAPPFHPDAGIIVDYDDLMPDPVQFVNIMGQAPPPPPPTAEKDEDMLPPGIDEKESEEFITKPITDVAHSSKGALPKDLEEALNIIFPGEKKSATDTEADAAKKIKGSNTETQIIVDEPVMQMEELVKEGIHLVTLNETSVAGGVEDASQMSMNEPLIFNKPSKILSHALPSNPVMHADIKDMNANANSNNRTDVQFEQNVITTQTSEMSADSNDRKSTTADLIPPLQITRGEHIIDNHRIAALPEEIPMPDNIPMPDEFADTDNLPTVSGMITDNTKDIKGTSPLLHEIDLADIPQPPPSPTESEKNRRQEQLEDLALLGIDADDMAAQCI